MKIILLTINLLLLVICAFSQDLPEAYELPVSKEAQIHAAIQNGRNQIVKEVIEGDHKAAIQTLDQLKVKYDKNYVILYPREEVLVALATRKFEILVDSALNYNPVIAKNKKAFMFEDFRDTLCSYMLPEIELISAELEKTSLAAKEKAIIRIYIDFLFSEDISELNKAIKNYRKDYSKTLYTNFLNTLKRITINSRINFSIGYGYDLIGDKISDSYCNSLNTAKVELDGFIKQTYFSLFIAGGASNVNTAHSFRDENERIFIVAGEKVSSQKYGFKLGRILYSSGKIKLYPYIALGGMEFSPPTVLFKYWDILPTDLIRLSSAFTGIGASCDILVKNWKPKHMYDPEGYFFIRPTIGYDRLFTETKISNPNNLYFSVSLGVGIGPKR